MKLQRQMKRKKQQQPGRRGRPPLRARRVSSRNTLPEWAALSATVHEAKTAAQAKLPTTEESPLRIAVGDTDDEDEWLPASAAPLWRILNSNTYHGFSSAYRLNYDVLSPDAFSRMSVNLALSIIDEGALHQLDKLVKSKACPHAEGTLVLLRFIRKWWDALADTHVTAKEADWEKKKKKVLAEIRAEWQRMFRLHDLHMDQHRAAMHAAKRAAKTKDGEPAASKPLCPRYPSEPLRREMVASGEALEETLNYIFKRAKQLQCDIRPVIAKLSTDYTEHLVGASRQLYHKNGLLTASNSAYAVRRLQHSEVIRLETGVRPAAAAPAASTSSSSRTPSVDETAEVEAEENEEDEEDVHPGNEGGSRASGLPKANRGHRGMLKRMGM